MHDNGNKELINNGRRLKRKQREYRARRKATMQNITTTSVVSQIVPASSPAGE